MLKSVFVLQTSTTTRSCQDPLTRIISGRQVASKAGSIVPRLPPLLLRPLSLLI